MASSFAALAKTTRHHLPLLREIAGTSGARVYSAVLSLVTLILTARWLGAQGRGVVVVVITWVTLVSGIAHLSIGQVLVHRAANEPDQQWVGPALAAVVLITGVASVAGWLVVAFCYVAFNARLFVGIPAQALTLGFVALPFFIWEQYGSALLSVLGRLRTYNGAQIVGRTLGLVILILGIKLLGLGIYGFLMAWVTAQIIVSSTGATALMRHSRGRLSGGLNAVGWLIRDSLKLHLNAIGVLLFSGVDILMLQYFRGPAEAAIFQLPMQLFLAMLLVPQAAQLALQARVAARTKAEFWREHRAVIAYVTAGMTSIAGALWVMAPWLVPFIGSHRFAGSTAVFRILLVGVPCASFNTLMGVQWIIRGYFWPVSLVTVATGLLNCALNFVLIPACGANGAAGAAVVGICAVPLLANGWMAFVAQREFIRSKAANVCA